MRQTTLCRRKLSGLVCSYTVWIAFLLHLLPTFLLYRSLSMRQGSGPSLRRVLLKTSLSLSSSTCRRDMKFAGVYYSYHDHGLLFLSTEGRATSPSNPSISSSPLVWCWEGGDYVVISNGRTGDSTTYHLWQIQDNRTLSEKYLIQRRKEGFLVPEQAFYKIYPTDSAASFFRIRFLTTGQISTEMLREGSSFGGTWALAPLGNFLYVRIVLGNGNSIELEMLTSDHGRTWHCSQQWYQLELDSTQDITFYSKSITDLLRQFEVRNAAIVIKVKFVITANSPFPLLTQLSVSLFNYYRLTKLMLQTISGVLKKKY